MSAPNWYAERGTYDEELRRLWEEDRMTGWMMDYMDYLSERDFDDDYPPDGPKEYDE